MLITVIIVNRLSVVTNFALFADQSEKVENIKKSVEKAKEAVQCDVKDGMSWCKLIEFNIAMNSRFDSFACKTSNFVSCNLQNCNISLSHNTSK